MISVVVVPVIVIIVIVLGLFFVWFPYVFLHHDPGIVCSFVAALGFSLPRRSWSKMIAIVCQLRPSVLMPVKSRWGPVGNPKICQVSLLLLLLNMVVEPTWLSGSTGRYPCTENPYYQSMGVGVWTIRWHDWKSGKQLLATIWATTSGQFNCHTPIHGSGGSMESTIHV